MRKILLFTAFVAVFTWMAWAADVNKEMTNAARRDEDMTSGQRGSKFFARQVEVHSGDPGRDQGRPWNRRQTWQRRGELPDQLRLECTRVY